MKVMMKEIEMVKYMIEEKVNGRKREEERGKR